MINQIEKWKELGFDQDPRLEFGEAYENLTFEDITTFYQKYLKGKPITISIVGDKKQIDLKALEQFGKVIQLKKKDIYVN
jgi:predicted Zn-dependent peptidase